MNSDQNSPIFITDSLLMPYFYGLGVRREGGVSLKLSLLIALYIFLDFIHLKSFKPHAGTLFLSRE